MDVIKKESYNMVLIMEVLISQALTGLEVDVTGRRFLDLTHDCFLTQHVLKPTRYDN